MQKMEHSSNEKLAPKRRSLGQKIVNLKPLETLALPLGPHFAKLSLYGLGETSSQASREVQYITQMQPDS